MSQMSEHQAKTQAALTAVLEAGRLTGTTRDRASGLLERLRSPTRVSVLGLPGTGKTGIVNLLAGAAVVPEAPSLGTVMLTHGAVDKTTYTLGDGTTLTQDGLPDVQELDDQRPALTRIETALPALAKISLMELAMPDDLQQQLRALQWAARQTDIAIWCTDTHLDREQDLWASMPDGLKDHAILLRTRADLLENWREEAIVAISKTGREDFGHVLGVSVFEAREAAIGGHVDKELMRASGAMALISTILKKIEQGRENMVDQADLILQRLASAKAATVPPKKAAPKPAAKPVAPKAAAPKPQPKPKPAAPKAPLVSAETPKAPTTAPTQKVRRKKVVVRSNVSRIVAPDAVAQPPKGADAPRSAAPTASKPSPTGLPPVLQSAFMEAIGSLQNVGKSLGNPSDVDARRVLGTGAKTLTDLTTRLWDDDLPEHPELERFRDMTQDAEDLIQLLRIEDSEDGAVDAVSAMLQLKRGFQAALAA